MGSLQFENLANNSTKTTLEALVSAINLWKKGHKAVFNFNCRGGLAWLNFSAFLGHADIRKENDGAEIKIKLNDDKKKNQPSPSKKKRSAIRAAKFRENRTRKEDDYTKGAGEEETKEEEKETIATQISLLPGRKTC